MENFIQISDSELIIMRVVWNNNNSVLFAKIMSDLYEMDKKWKPNTVLTFLVRLIEKGFVSSVKHGRINEYTAVITMQDYIADQTKTFVNKVYGGNAMYLVSALIKNDYINSSDIDELKSFWDEGKKTI